MLKKIPFIFLIFLFCSVSRQSWGDEDIGGDTTFDILDAESDIPRDIDQESSRDTSDVPDVACQEGDKRCSEDGKVQTCSRNAEDPLDWQDDPAQCESFEVCQEGQCICDTSNCKIGLYRCQASWIQVCQELKTDCNEWSGHLNCGDIAQGFECVNSTDCSSGELILNQSRPADQKNEDSSYSDGFSTIKLLPNNTFVVVWRSSHVNYNEDEIRLGIFNSLGQSVFSGDIPVSLQTGNIQQGPSLEITEQGDIIVVWAYYDASPHNILWVRRFSSQGTPLNHYSIVDMTQMSVSYPYIRKISDKSFVVSWSSATGSIDHFIGLHRLDSRGERIGTEKRLTLDSDHWVRSQIGELPDAKFVLTWWDRDTSYPVEGSKHILLQLFNSSLNSINAVSQILPDQESGHPNVNGPYFIKLSDSRFLIGWLETLTNERRLVTNLYQFDNDGNSFALIQARIQISETNFDNQFSLGSFRLQDNRTMILWSDEDYIYGKIMNSQGTNVPSSIKLISTDLAYGVTGIEVNEFFYFLTWSSYRGDGNGWDIYGNVIYKLLE